MILNITDRYILILDVETANDTADAIVYDIGFILLDLYTGIICEQGSFVIRDTFVYERELVKVAYYADKIPEYVHDIQQGKRQMVDFIVARRHILNIMEKYDCHTVAAYNASFDRNALNTTLRYLTKSKYRYFFPYSTEFVCIWNMACQTICQTSEYKTFAETNRHYSNHGKNYRATAETVYQFLINDPNFHEEHKGYDDVKIEKEIMEKCLEYDKNFKGISRSCWMKVKRGALMLRVNFLLISGRPDSLHRINLTSLLNFDILYIEKERRLCQMNEILCPDCGHDLEIYETDIESHDEQLSLRCQGWCPNCKNAAKVFVWYETFQLISNTKPKQIR